MAGNYGVNGFFLLLDATDAAGDNGLGFDGEDGVGIEVVEAEAEYSEVGGELGVGAVEKNVFLEMGLAVVAGEDGGEALVGSGIL